MAGRSGRLLAVGSLITTGSQKSVQRPLPSTGQHGHKFAVVAPTRSMDHSPSDLDKPTGSLG
ncbi:hypothetical protein ACJ73_03109 [Blastomyces percursus]|uniref:Uncharacterized protein n=1 Tax=Blastomyces percursus TaxID=1658174 RepID=A0A1J9RCX4_9EURO|nr:hypothetical protein ACJ73_03109 [Blastomyces percursus]